MKTLQQHNEHASSASVGGIKYEDLREIKSKINGLIPIRTLCIQRVWIMTHHLGLIDASRCLNGARCVQGDAQLRLDPQYRPLHLRDQVCIAVKVEGAHVLKDSPAWLVQVNLN